MKLLRKIIRKTILKEVTNFSCNKNSLGWISADGEFIDLSEIGMEHDEYINSITEFTEDDEFILSHNIPIPDGWIKVSNSRELQIYGVSWEHISKSQVKGIINMWLKCSRYCKWMQNIEEEEILLWFDNKKSRYTIPDFLYEFGSRDLVEYFFHNLLKK